MGLKGIILPKHGRHRHCKEEITINDSINHLFPNHKLYLFKSG